MHKVLVIMLRYIGDVLLATPVTRALREHAPSAHLAMAVNPGTGEILAGNPDVNQVIPVERGSLRAQLGFMSRLRAERFDTVIDLTDGDRSAIIARWTGAPVRVGFNEERRWRGLLYTHVARLPDGPLHRIDRNLHALRALGIDPKSSAPVVSPAFKEERDGRELLKRVLPDGLQHRLDRPLVMLHPGARYWFKAWPEERFAELADGLSESFGCTMLIGGGADDRERAERIAARARCGPLVLAGRLTLGQFSTVLAGCRLFVGNDAGPMHIAAALGVPVVALFGPTDPAVWGPYTERKAVLYKGLDCRACFRPGCFRGEASCMRLITTDEVFKAACKYLE